MSALYVFLFPDLFFIVVIMFFSESVWLKPQFVLNTFVLSEVDFILYFSISFLHQSHVYNNKTSKINTTLNWTPL